MSEKKERRNEVIVRRIARGERSAKVAKHYGITQTRVRQIVRAHNAASALARMAERISP